MRPVQLCHDCPNGSEVPCVGNIFSCLALNKIVSPPSHCSYYAGSLFPIDVIVITAVQVEFDAVMQWLHPEGVEAWDTLSTITDGIWKTSTYAIGSPKKYARIAVAKTRTMGLSATAVLTAQAIQLFRPSHVLMAGITAGYHDSTKIGDVIVPQELWDYGAGKWEEQQEASSSESKLVFKSRAEHQSMDEHIRQHCFELSTSNIMQDIVTDWNIANPEAVYSKPSINMGPMVSGAAVVNAEQIWNQVHRQNDKIVALEMEAYALALATAQARTSKYQPDFLVAKSVCDYGMKKEKSAQRYAAFTSVRFLRHYIESFVLGTQVIRNPTRENVVGFE